MITLRLAVNGEVQTWVLAAVTAVVPVLFKLMLSAKDDQYKDMRGQYEERLKECQERNKKMEEAFWRITETAGTAVRKIKAEP